MNANRRKTLSKIAEQLSALKDSIEEEQAELQNVVDEEDECRENMAARSGPNYEASEEASDYINEVISNIDDVMSTLEEAISNIKNIKG